VISRMVVPRRKGRRWLTALSTLSIVAGVLVFGSPTLGLTQTEFELDKNATDDLATEHLGTLKSSVNSTATSFVVCERQFDITNDGINNPVVVPIPAVPFTIQVDAEQMTVTAKTNPSNKTGGCSFSDPADSAAQVETWAVSRHVNGTTAASHSGSSDMTHMLTGAAAGDDWDQVYASVTADADDIGDDDKCIALGAVECSWVHDTFDVTVFTTGGSKDDLNINPLAGEAGTGWKWTDSSVPPSDEILDAFAAKYSNGRQLLFFGADRWSTNGAKDFGFWFFHDQVVACPEVGTPTGACDGVPDGQFSGNHTAPSGTSRGDILLLGTFSQGGAVTTLRVFEWYGTGGNTNGTLQSLGTFGDCAAGGGSDEGCNTVNNTTVPSPWSYLGAASGAAPNTFYAGALMEGGIDLTELGLEGCFASFMAETRSSPEPGAQLKDFVLGNFEACESGLVTTPKDGTGNPLATDSDGDGLDEVTIGTGDVGVDVTDSAELTVSGTAFTGTLSFFICGPIDDPATCATGGVPAGSSTVTTNGAHSSDSVNLTEVGRYCWRGFFDSDTNGVDDATDASTGECFEVLPVQPTISTNATAAVKVGSPISDTATLGGTAYQPGDDGGDGSGNYLSINATMDTPANGSIVFNSYGPGDATCAGVADFTSTGFTVSGDSPPAYGPASYTPDTTGTYRWIAAYTSGDANTKDVSGSCNDANETSVVVDAEAEIEASATNQVGEEHTFTVTIRADHGDGAGFVAEAGVDVTASLDAASTAGTITGGSCLTDPTDSAGQCTVTVDSNVTGVAIVNADATVTVEGVAIDVSTTGYGFVVVDNTKTWVDAQISIATDATNEVGNAHTFTVTVEADYGDGAGFVPIAGVDVTAVLDDLSTQGSITGGSCLTDSTDAAGQCTVTVNSDVAGVAIVDASATVDVSGVFIDVATDGYGADVVENTKTWVDAYITINPPEDTNTVGDPHTFTIAVFQDDGRPASEGDGVDGWTAAPDGTPVDVDLTDTDGSLNDVSSDTCASPGTSAGLCTVTFTSPTAGTVIGHASVTFLVGGVSLSRETDGDAPNSDDAIKHFVAGSIAWSKVDNAGVAQGGATFELCRTHDYILPDGGIDPDPLDPPDCRDVIDNGLNDEDPAAGAFLVSGLALGEYTVHETAAPDGFEPDPDTETVQLVPGDTEAVIGEAFVNSRPILKITGFGYENVATAPYFGGVVAGTVTYTVKLHNYGTAGAELTNSNLTVSANADCTGGNILDLSATLLDADDGLLGGTDDASFTLVCTYANPDPEAITATLVVKYTTNNLERTASGSPATITFTVTPEP